MILFLAGFLSGVVACVLVNVFWFGRRRDEPAAITPRDLERYS
jgi:hypothetical protein